MTDAMDSAQTRTGLLAVLIGGLLLAGAVDCAAEDPRPFAPEGWPPHWIGHSTGDVDAILSPATTLAGRGPGDRLLFESDDLFPQVTADASTAPAVSTAAWLSPAPQNEPESILQTAWEVCPPVASPVKYPTASLTGFFQVDAAWFAQDAASLRSVGDIPDIVDFRRARLAARGQAAENVGYMLEMDFAFPGRPNFMDVYLELQNPETVSVRVGQWRQPFGMDALTSARELWFLERGLPFAFLPFRQTGIGAFATEFDDSLTWAVSGYKYPVDPFGGNFGDDGYGMSTRVTLNPVFEESGNRVVHFGFDYSANSPSTESIRIRSTPEIGFTSGDFSGGPTAVPFFVDTGTINSQLLNLLGAEFGAALGSFTFQTEMIYALVDQVGGSSLTFPGAYAQAAYVLTGEHHPYNRKQGVFTRVIPEHNWGDCGCGAWEVAGRWSYIDLDDGNINGGVLNDLTFGVNWYLNRAAKFQFNYIHAILDHPVQGQSGTDILAVRGQIDF